MQTSGFVTVENWTVSFLRKPYKLPSRFVLNVPALDKQESGCTGSGR